MSKIVEAHTNTFDAVIKICNDNIDLINAVPDAANSLSTLIDYRSQMTTAFEIQAHNTSGITTNSNILKDDMAHDHYKFARKALPKARANGNEDMIEILDKSLTTLSRATKIESISLCKQIYDLLKANPTIFPNIKPQDIADMNDSRVAYDASKVDTSVAIKTRKVDGTQAIITLDAKCLAIIEDIYDYMYGEYIDTNPTFVEKLKAARDIEVEGIHHTGIRVHCLDANPPEDAITNLLQGVVFTIEELKITVISDINGVIEKIKFIPGTYHTSYTLPGFDTVNKIQKFNRGAIIKFDLNMNRTTPPDEIKPREIKPDEKKPE